MFVKKRSNEIQNFGKRPAVFTRTLGHTLGRRHGGQDHREHVVRELIVDLQPVDLGVQLDLVDRGPVLHPEAGLEGTADVASVRPQHFHVQIVDLEFRFFFH